MAPILGIWASGAQPPQYAGSFESIATATGTGSSSTLTFTSIPQTYTHLQLRGILRASGTAYDAGVQFAVNGTNIARNHGLYGDGSAAGAYTGTNGYLLQAFGGGATANAYTAIIIDVLDYTNTNKYKTLRCLMGEDSNGAGYVMLNSGLATDTNAVTSLTLTWPVTGSWTSYSTVALYGIKGS